MSSAEVVIVQTGSANLASVRAMLERLGARCRISDDAGVVGSARLVVLPGVGAFGPAMQGLRARGLDRVLTERARQGRPLLAICLGMQLLFDSSEESPGERGLGVVPGRLRRFDGVRTPQMGWNRITPTPDAELLRSMAAYFANSYRLDQMPEGWAGATAEHGGAFVAAVERRAVLACQFHPEISGADGMALIGRWIALSRERGDGRC